MIAMIAKAMPATVPPMIAPSVVAFLWLSSEAEQFEHGDWEGGLTIACEDAGSREVGRFVCEAGSSEVVGGLA